MAEYMEEDSKEDFKPEDEVLDKNFEEEEENYWKNWVLNYGDNPSRKEFMMKEMVKERRITIKLRRDFFFKEFQQTVVMKDGPASQTLIRESVSTKNELIFKGKKIMGVNVNGELKFYPNKSLKGLIGEFKDLLKKAEDEHSSTFWGKVEENVGSPVGEEDLGRIRENIYYTWNSDLDVKLNLERGTKLTGQEFKELEGVKHAKMLKRNIPFLETNAGYFFEKADNEEDLERKKELKMIGKMSLEKADLIRLKIGEEKEEEEGGLGEKEVFYDAKEFLNEKIENDILTKFERFKKFVKENLGNIAGIVISIGGVIVTIIMYTSTGIVTAAQSAAATVAALTKLVKKSKGLAPFLGVLISALSWGAEGLTWLSKNLWVISIFFGIFLSVEPPFKFLRRW